MYRVSDGFNLEDGDGKTYFDKYNVMDLLNVSRSKAATEMKIYPTSNKYVSSSAAYLVS